VHRSKYFREVIVNAELSQINTAGDRSTREFSMNLRYVGNSRIEVRGAFTGEIYRFTSTEPVVPVNISDAKALLACNLFTIA
jgi:hypothetical protein